MSANFWKKCFTRKYVIRLADMNFAILIRNVMRPPIINSSKTHLKCHPHIRFRDEAVEYEHGILAPFWTDQGNTLTH